MVDLLIDANSLYARAWYACMAAGKSVDDVVRSSLASVLLLLNSADRNFDGRVDRLLFAWDGPNHRDKARAPKPLAYHDTLNLLRQCYELMFRPASVMVEGYEADDVIATAARASTSETVIVVSGDKDLQQLANDRCRYYSLNEKMILPNRIILNKWGVKHPCQISIALALLGDKVDNIEGLKGYGPKKVAKLFASIPNEMPLEEVLEAIVGQLPPESHGQFYRDLDLTLLHFDIPGVPQAAPIQLAETQVVEKLDLPDLMPLYRNCWHLYAKRTSPVGDEEEVPEEVPL